MSYYNTPKSKETFVFDRKTGKCMSHIIGGDFPEIDNDLLCCVDYGIPHEDLLMITDERFDNPGKSAII